jgi:hypothetical protein
MAYPFRIGPWDFLGTVQGEPLQGTAANISDTCSACARGSYHDAISSHVLLHLFHLAHVFVQLLLHPTADTAAAYLFEESSEAAPSILTCGTQTAETLALRLPRRAFQRRMKESCCRFVHTCDEKRERKDISALALMGGRHDRSKAEI